MSIYKYLKFNNNNKRKIVGGLENLNSLSFNISGLRNKKKRTSIFRFFRQEKLDIVALQETHINEKEIDKIKHEWGSDVFINKGATTHSKGLMFLISRKIRQNFEKITVIYSDDRILIIRISETSGNAYLFTNIYAPCVSNEKIVFFQYAYDIIKSVKNEYNDDPLICMGDFNCVLSNELDIISGEPHPSVHIKEFNDFLIGLNLYDVWRLKNEQCKEHSWRRGKIARRLDYVLVDERLIHLVNDVSLKSCGFSDHRALKTVLIFSSTKRGPGIFKMNTSLLQDHTFVKLINERINEVIDNNDDLNPHLLWESIKIEIKESTKLYSKNRAISTRKIMEEKILVLNQKEKELALKPDCDEIINMINNIKKDLEIKRMADTKAAQIRAGIKWIEEGEKSTKYFLSPLSEIC